MRTEELRDELKARFGDRKGAWLWSCMTASIWGCPDQPERYEAICRASADTGEFLQRVREDDALRYFQAWGEFGKLLNWDVPISPEAKVYRAYSDAGGVLVGDAAGTFAYLVPNGYGDGETKVVVAEQPDLFNQDMLRNMGAIDGCTWVYRYDCASPGDESERLLTLQGRYVVYSGSRIVVFERL